MEPYNKINTKNTLVLGAVILIIAIGIILVSFNLFEAPDPNTQAKKLCKSYADEENPFSCIDSAVRALEDTPGRLVNVATGTRVAPLNPQSGNATEPVKVSTWVFTIKSENSKVYEVLVGASGDIGILKREKP